ncbi:MAG: hypothetical protein AAGF35_09450 [Pseudomonadota bacterium]
MYVTSNRGIRQTVGGEPLEVLTYQIIGHSENGLRAVLEGEERRTPSGNVVVWNLLLMNKNEFCWHRADWRKGSCTNPLKRCNIAY